MSVSSNSSSHRIVRHYNGPADHYVHRIAFSPNGNQLAVIYRHNNMSNGTSIVKVIDRDGAEKELQFDHSVFAISFSANNNELACGGNDKILTFIDAKDMKIIGTSIQRENTIESIAYTNNGKYFATGESNGRIGILNATTKTTIRELNCEGGIHTVSFTKDSKHVIGGGPVGNLYIFEVETFKEVKQIDIGAWIESSSVSPNGEYIVICGDNKKVTVIKTNDWSKHKEMKLSDELNSVSFSADGNTLAVGGDDGMVTIFNPHSGDAVSEINFGNIVFTVTFSPIIGDNLLAVGGDDSWKIYESTASPTITITTPFKSKLTVIKEWLGFGVAEPVPKPMIKSGKKPFADSLEPKVVEPKKSKTETYTKAEELASKAKHMIKSEKKVRADPPVGRFTGTLRDNALNVIKTELRRMESLFLLPSLKDLFLLSSLNDDSGIAFLVENCTLSSSQDGLSMEIKSDNHGTIRLLYSGLVLQISFEAIEIESKYGSLSRLSCHLLNKFYLKPVEMNVPLLFGSTNGSEAQTVDGQDIARGDKHSFSTFFEENWKLTIEAIQVTKGGKGGLEDDQVDLSPGDFKLNLILENSKNGDDIGDDSHICVHMKVICDDEIVGRHDKNRYHFKKSNFGLFVPNTYYSYDKKWNKMQSNIMNTGYPVLCFGSSAYGSPNDFFFGSLLRSFWSMTSWLLFWEAYPSESQFVTFQFRASSKIVYDPIFTQNQNVSDYGANLISETQEKKNLLRFYLRFRFRIHILYLIFISLNYLHFKSDKVAKSFLSGAFSFFHKLFEKQKRDDNKITNFLWDNKMEILLALFLMLFVDLVCKVFAFAQSSSTTEADPTGCETLQVETETSQNSGSTLAVVESAHVGTNNMISVQTGSEVVLTESVPVQAETLRTDIGSVQAEVETAHVEANDMVPAQTGSEAVQTEILQVDSGSVHAEAENADVETNDMACAQTGSETVQTQSVTVQTETLQVNSGSVQAEVQTAQVERNAMVSKTVLFAEQKKTNKVLKSLKAGIQIKYLENFENYFGDLSVPKLSIDAGKTCRQRNHRRFDCIDGGEEGVLRLLRINSIDAKARLNILGFGQKKLFKVETYLIRSAKEEGTKKLMGLHNSEEIVDFFDFTFNRNPVVQAVIDERKNRRLIKTKERIDYIKTENNEQEKQILHYAYPKEKEKERAWISEFDTNEVTEVSQYSSNDRRVEVLKGGDLTVDAGKIISLALRNYGLTIGLDEIDEQLETAKIDYNTGSLFVCCNMNEEIKGTFFASLSRKKIMLEMYCITPLSRSAIDEVGKLKNHQSYQNTIDFYKKKFGGDGEMYTSEEWYENARKRIIKSHLEGE